MATKSQTDRQKQWEDKISRAKAVRANWAKQFKVETGRDYFEGKQNPGMPDDEWITINKIYSHVKANLPALYAQDPYFYVKLKRSFSPNPMDIAMYEQRAKIRQAYLNYLKDEIQLKAEVRLCVQDGEFEYGIAKTHYVTNQIKNPDAGNPILGDNGLPMVDENTMEILVEPEMIPVDERYVVERVHPNDFVWDEDAGPTPRSWKWCAQHLTMSIEEARENPLFNKAALKALEKKTSDSETSSTDRQKREERKKGGDIKGKSEGADKTQDKDEKKTVHLWEIYELEKKRWSVIAENGDIPLVDGEELPPGTEKMPYSILRFTYRDDSPYPIPPISQGLDVQKEFNTARSRVMTHRKRFNRKYVAAGQWDDAELSKIESGDDGAIAKSQVPGSTITPIQDAPLDQMGYMEINYLNNDLIELLGGSTDESRGIAGADSATQASILDKRLDMKEGDAISMVVEFVKDIARKLDQLVQAHISQDEAVKITGPQGEFWQLVKADDYGAINGEFEYDVNVGATIPRMPQTERASWMAFLQLVATVPQLLTSKALLKEMAQQHHIENEALIDEIYRIGQMMMQQQAAAGEGPATPGSMPGVTETKPGTITGGQAGGSKSLNLPLAGNARE
ncbi:MAG: hypothetical protein ACYDG4_13495 [Desulfuromonadaceae bacterium]